MAYIYQISPDGGTTKYPVSTSLYGTANWHSSSSRQIDVTCSDYDALQPNAVIFVKFNMAPRTTGSGQYTMSVNGTTEKQIISGSGEVITQNNVARAWVQYATVPMIYNGTYWVMCATPDYDNDTKNTAGSSNSASKLYLVGAASQSSSGVTTYSNSGVYATNGAFVCDTVSTDGGSHNYELGAACEKGIGSVTDGNTDLVTGDAVYDAIQAAIGQATGSMVYQGPVSSSAALKNVAQKAGYVYMADTAFTITDGSSVVHGVEVGDMIIFNTDGTYTTDAALWAAIDMYQSNLDRLTDTDIDNAIAEAEAA